MTFCMDCGRQEAAVYLKIAVNNKLAGVRLCAACAAKKGAPPGRSCSGSLDTPDMAGGAGPGFKEFLPEERAALRCPACALTYREFRETGKLGCPGCYAAFETQLSGLLPRLYGAGLETAEGPPAPVSKRPISRGVKKRKAHGGDADGWRA